MCGELLASDEFIDKWSKQLVGSFFKLTPSSDQSSKHLELEVQRLVADAIRSDQPVVKLWEQLLLASNGAKAGALAAIPAEC